MLVGTAAMAADQKIAVVDFQAVMKDIPQSAIIMQTLEAEFKDEKAVIAQLVKDIKYYEEKQKRDGSLMTDKEKQDLEKQIATLFQEYQTKGKAFQQSSGVRQNEETNKIIELVSKTVNKIAKEEGYDLVLQKQAVVFSDDKYSITTEVIKQVSKLK